MSIISRAEAKAAGSKRYFTGVACPRNHVGERFASTGGCVLCCAENSARARLNNPEKAKEIDLRSKAKHRDRILEENRLLYLKNAEARREYSRQYRAMNPEKVKESDRLAKLKNREQRLAKDRERRARNTDQLKEYRKKYYAANKAKILAANAEWYKQNPEQNRANQHTQRAKRSGAEGSHTKQEIRGLLTKQGHKCACCSVSIKRRYHIDHITPLSRGGTNWARNLQLTCPKCNLSKNDSDPITFMQSLGKLL
jgi:5-methylcytosine-specific restriction endonuclease McrA